MDYILAMTRNDGLNYKPPSSEKQPARNEPSYLAKSRINARIGSLDSEIASIDHDIAQLAKLKQELVKERRTLQVELDAVDTTRSVEHANAPCSSKSKESPGIIDYTEEFEWSGSMHGRMREVFGINSFRLCQQG